MTKKAKNKSLKKGNREIITDYYVDSDIKGEQGSLNYKVFVRLNANHKNFTKVSFMHCIFDNCYLKDCVFDSCDFTGCKFLDSNFHLTAFKGCDFRYTTFQNSHIDDDILALSLIHI